MKTGGRFPWGAMSGRRVTGWGWGPGHRGAPVTPENGEGSPFLAWGVPQGLWNVRSHPCSQATAFCCKPAELSEGPSQPFGPKMGRLLDTRESTHKASHGKT